MAWVMRFCTFAVCVIIAVFVVTSSDWTINITSKPRKPIVDTINQRIGENTTDIVWKIVKNVMW